MLPSRRDGRCVKTAIDGLGCLVLMAVFLEDLRAYRIRNGWVLVLLGLAVLSIYVDADSSGFIWHGGFALAAFALVFAAFTLRMIGAGDAKLLVVACFWLGPERSLVFAACLMILSVIYALGVYFLRFQHVRTERGVKIPFGPSISSAWIANIVLTNAV